MTESMDKVFESAFDEQVKDIVASKHPAIEQQPREVAEEAMSKAAEMALPLLKKMKLRIGFAINLPDKLIVILESNGKRETVEYDAEFELTSKEIICRYENGPTIFTLDENNLKARNEELGAYPKYFQLFREQKSNPAKTEKPSKTTSR